MLSAVIRGMEIIAMMIIINFTVTDAVTDFKHISIKKKNYLNSSRKQLAEILPCSSGKQTLTNRLANIDKQMTGIVTWTSVMFAEKIQRRPSSVPHQ